MMNIRKVRAEAQICINRVRGIQILVFAACIPKRVQQLLPKVSHHLSNTKSQPTKNLGELQMLSLPHLMRIIMLKPLKRILFLEIFKHQYKQEMRSEKYLIKRSKRVKSSSLQYCLITIKKGLVLEEE
jgi:hypothetical protein